MTNVVPNFFDSFALRRNRQRAASSYAKFSFLKDEAAMRLADRVDLMRYNFDLCLDIGAHDGRLWNHLACLGKIGTMLHSDPGAKFAENSSWPFVVHDFTTLPFAEGKFDAVFSCLNLHWIDDLPGLILQIRNLLRPNGLCLISLLGGNSLNELRASMIAAEQDIIGGSSPRCAPMADIRDVGGLLARAGLALPVADSDRLTVNYPHMFRLMEDLRGMGEQNALIGRQRYPTRRDVFLRAAEIYQEKFGKADGSIPVSFEIITLTGWAPHSSQQKPLRPGSAKTRFANVVGRD
ncbi:methyltransferase domain-containing protein [Candidatus Puniceispirillum sp.]|nr:methyltransferase domain-containing protein [Candidatus Puniceispirillum sp.]